MDFIKKQVEKEKVSIKRLWDKYLTVLCIYWAIIGFAILFSPGYPIGIIFLLGAGYVIYRRRNKKIKS